MTSIDEQNDSVPTDGTCKIRFKKSSKNTPVILANFSNGKLKSHHRSGIKFQCYTSAGNPEMEPKNEDRILVADNGRLQYTGSTFGAAAENNNGVRYMVGVRSKSTGKMRLYDSVSFRLRPLITAPVSICDDNVANKSLQEKRDELTSCFGSKVGKRAMASRIKHATNKDDLLLGAAHELEHISVKDLSKSVPASPAVATVVIPPQNDEATQVEDVYSITDIITEEEFAELNEEAHKVMSASDEDKLQWKNDNHYCSYLMHHVENMELDMGKAKLLVYYNYLMSFAKLTYKDLRRKDPDLNIPETYKQNLLKNFTVTMRQENGQFSRNFPLAMKDKIIAHAFVLALFIDDFCVSLDLVQSDIKIAAARMIRIAQVLGCHIITKTENNEKIKFAHLKFPLFVATQKRYSKIKR